MRPCTCVSRTISQVWHKALYLCVQDYITGMTWGPVPVCPGLYHRYDIRPCTCVFRTISQVWHEALYLCVRDYITRMTWGPVPVCPGLYHRYDIRPCTCVSRTISQVWHKALYMCVQDYITCMTWGPVPVCPGCWSAPPPVGPPDSAGAWGSHSYIAWSPRLAPQRPVIHYRTSGCQAMQLKLSHLNVSIKMPFVFIYKNTNKTWTISIWDCWEHYII